LSQVLSAPGTGNLYSKMARVASYISGWAILASEGARLMSEYTWSNTACSTMLSASWLQTSYSAPTHCAHSGASNRQRACYEQIGRRCECPCGRPSRSANSFTSSFDSPANSVTASTFRPGALSSSRRSSGCAGMTKSMLLPCANNTRIEPWRAASRKAHCRAQERPAQHCSAAAVAVCHCRCVHLSHFLFAPNLNAQNKFFN